METILIEFINTLDAQLKKVQAQAGQDSGFSRLTINQYHYIEAVHALGEPTITEVAEKLNITKASVTTGINKLVGLGFVVKTQSSADRRVFHVCLTERSARLLQAKQVALSGYVAFIRAALSDEEARQFEATLAKLVKHFGQEP
jgi:DNA-binding MarR family transcriptional regulator